MNRGRKPLGDRAMSVAEQRARLREAHPTGAPRVRYRRRAADRRSRPQRWRDAMAELVELQGEYRDWLDTLPPSLESSATAEALRAICDLDLSELESVEPPRGFGATDPGACVDWGSRSAQAGHDPRHRSLRWSRRMASRFRLTTRPRRVVLGTILISLGMLLWVIAVTLPLTAPFGSLGVVFGGALVVGGIILISAFI